MSSHKTYPNPTIVEAICEVHFVLADDSDWNPNRPAAVFKCLNEQFPVMEPVSDIGVQITIDENGPSQRPIKAPARIKFTNDAGDRLVQLTQETFVFNVIGSYPGWPIFRDAIYETYSQISKVIGASEFSRVGLRYINSIPKSKQHPRLSDWLKPTDFLSKALIQSTNGCKSRQEISFDSSHWMHIQLVDTNLVSEQDSGTIVFDIDQVLVGDKPSGNIGINEILEKLHENVRSVFDEATTKNLIQFLESTEG